MENKKQGYMETLMIEMRNGKTRIHGFNNIPFPKNLSVKEMFEKKLHALFVLTKVHYTVHALFTVERNSENSLALQT